jgi:hypothetical protein
MVHGSFLTEMVSLMVVVLGSFEVAGLLSIGTVGEREERWLRNVIIGLVGWGPAYLMAGANASWNSLGAGRDSLHF